MWLGDVFGSSKRWQNNKFDKQLWQYIIWYIFYNVQFNCSFVLCFAWKGMESPCNNWHSLEYNYNIEMSLNIVLYYYKIGCLLGLLEKCCLLRTPVGILWRNISQIVYLFEIVSMHIHFGPSSWLWIILHQSVLTDIN